MATDVPPNLQQTASAVVQNLPSNPLSQEERRRRNSVLDNVNARLADKNGSSQG